MVALLFEHGICFRLHSAGAAGPAPASVGSLAVLSLVCQRGATSGWLQTLRAILVDLTVACTRQGKRLLAIKLSAGKVSACTVPQGPEICLIQSVMDAAAGGATGPTLQTGTTVCDSREQLTLAACRAGDAVCSAMRVGGLEKVHRVCCSSSAWLGVM